MEKLHFQIDQRFPQRICGIMTGTSGDGIDMAVIERTAPNLPGEIIEYDASDIPPDDYILYFNGIDKKRLRFPEIIELQHRLHSMLIEQIRLLRHRPDVIGFHGQTLYHQPPEGSSNGYSWQIGDGSVIAKQTGIPVIYNFRNGDTALGGHGAPLVPWSDFIRYNDPEKHQLLINLGGIANGTWLPPGNDFSTVRAGDFGPAGALTNCLMRSLFDLPFDPAGDHARQGQVDWNFVREWVDNDSFISQPFPKSTGRERYDRDMAESLNRTLRERGCNPYDRIATVTELTVAAIQVQLQPKPDEILISGGGTHNQYLYERLRDSLPNVSLIDGDGGHFKEAIAFADLAAAFLDQKCASGAGTTGINRPTVLGVYALP